MSRRIRRAEKSSRYWWTGARPREPGDHRLRVICTDRGQHPPIALGLFSLTDEGGLIERGGRERWLVSVQSRTRGFTNTERHDDGKSLRFVCARCGRDVLLRWDTATEIVRRFTDSGHPALDISSI